MVEQQPNEKRDRKGEGYPSGLWNFLALILALVVAIVGLFGKAPTWFWVTTLVLIVGTVVVPPLITKLLHLRSSAQSWKGVKGLIPEFEAFVRQFVEWSEQDRTTLHSQIWKYFLEDSLVSPVTYRAPGLYALNFLALSASPLLLSPSKNAHDFSHKVKLFDALLNLLKKEYVEEPLSFLGIQPPESLYRRNVHRAVLRKYYPVYEKFLIDYSNWAKRLNTAAGDRISWMENYMPPNVRPDDL